MGKLIRFRINPVPKDIGVGLPPPPPLTWQQQGDGSWVGILEYGGAVNDVVKVEPIGVGWWVSDRFDAGYWPVPTYDDDEVFDTAEAAMQAVDAHTA
jgi:hypothetical protein